MNLTNPPPVAEAEASRRRSARLRLRVAWMYYAEDMTQGAIAEQLGIGRVTVTRLLADAKAMHEVSISLSREIADLPRLEVSLERRFGLREAIVAPLSNPKADPTVAIGAATGAFLGGMMQPATRIGVGWGRTLHSSLDFLEGGQADTVVSLLGGLSAVEHYNPAEFAWAFSRLFKARCYLVAAPAIVDDADTKRRLIDHCGVGESLARSETLDAVLLSVGGMSPLRPTVTTEPYPPSVHDELLRAGAVGNMLYNFFDARGRVVDHPINARVMSAPLPTLCRAPERILASGGADKIAALRGAMTLIKPTVLITDEVTAGLLLED
ncbi:sugar-binding transcriptional regulator [Paragemmobacter straminiformis]|uniref:Sugar-binding transcriptional regulator n=1 Tax=Paragemmobacter straminiformis TaxID=2045119 RepID=A0A842IEB9_9RHOB|nr:sugar-binding transcriptional regulator [Gemmobacter straminiformis]MBC2837593.1 sugar-binding transcriptional regulator [Gemmobacter straminiformis]